MAENILIQGFCQLRIKITQFPDGFHLQLFLMKTNVMTLDSYMYRKVMMMACQIMKKCGWRISEEIKLSLMD